MALKTSPVTAYLKQLERELKHGNATEHTHRRALQDFIEAIGGQGVQATNEPRRFACGVPDLIIVRNATPIGHIEAKDIGKSLDEQKYLLGFVRKQVGLIPLEQGS